MPSSEYVRRYPVSQEVTRTGTHFRVWAPIRKRVEVVVERGPIAALDSEGDGYFSAFVDGVSGGMRYRFRLDDGPACFPIRPHDFNPMGHMGHPRSSILVRSVGTIANGAVCLPNLKCCTSCTSARSPGRNVGGGDGVAAELADLGVTAIEVMPVAAISPAGSDGDTTAPACIRADATLRYAGRLPAFRRRRPRAASA